MRARRRRQQSERAKYTGSRRNNDVGYAEMIGHGSRVHRTAAAERQQKRLSRIAAALDGNRSNSPDHVGVGQLSHSPSDFLDGNATTTGDRFESSSCRVNIKDDASTGES